MKTLLTSAEKKALTLFLKIGTPDDLLSFQAQAILKPYFDIEKNYIQTVWNHNHQAYLNGRKNSVDLLNIVGDKKYVLFDFDRQIYTNLMNQSFTASAATLERIQGNIMKNISQSYSEGLGIRDAARNLQKEFRKIRTYEVERIARTEINGAQNRGAYQTYLDNAVEYHQWWTGQDARVRDSHKLLHGEIVRVGNSFSNGLSYPGDRSGPISEWIHCRCTTVPYLMPLGYMAPTGMSVFHETDIVPIPGFKVPNIYPV